MPRKKRKDKTYAKSDNTRKKGNRQGMRYDDDADDDYADDKEWRVMESQKQSQRSLARSSSATRRTRSKTRKAKNKDEVIEILDSSSEEESSDEEEMFSPGHDESNRIVEVSCDIAEWARFVYKHLLSNWYHILFLTECNKA